MKFSLFSALLFASSAFRAAGTPSAIARTGDIALRNTHIVAAPTDDRPWDLNIQTIVEGPVDFVSNTALKKISDAFTFGDHVITDETYLIEDDNSEPHQLMTDFANRISTTFPGYGIVGTQEKTVIGNPHFDFVWLGAEFRSKNNPTIRADVVLSKIIGAYIDVKEYYPDGLVNFISTSGGVNVVIRSDLGYERFTFTG